MIRKADYKKDLHIVHQVIKEAYEVEMGNTGLAFRTLPRWPDDVYSDVIKKDFENMYVYDDGEVKGCMGVDVENQVAFVGPLAVGLRFRNEGIGTKLIKFTETLAPVVQVDRVSCRTDLINFYDKLGFEKLYEDDVTKCVPEKQLSRRDLTTIVYQRKFN